MIINHNMASLNTYRQMSVNEKNTSDSLAKLSSGLRINKAGDDAAGLAISEKMRGQIRGLDQASRNAQDGISLIQTAEGGLNETHSMLQRMRELVVQANNGTNQDTDRSKIQDEISQLQTEINNVATRTQFNGQDLLHGTFGSKVANALGNVDGSAVFSVVNNGAAAATAYTVTTGDDSAAAEKYIQITNATTGVTQKISGVDLASIAAGDTFNFDKIGVSLKAVATSATAFVSIGANNTFDISGTSVDLQVGANSGQQMNLSINDMQATALGSATEKISAINVSVAGYGSTQFDTDIAAVDAAITQVSNERSKMGGWQNRLEHTIANLGTSSENLTAAESRVRDVDMAKEMMSFQKNNILQQAAQAMLAQANQQPQGVLQLLR